LGLDVYIGISIMLPLRFVGGAERDFLALPREAIREAGHQLWLVQEGEDPDDWKPMPSIGSGVREIRIWCADGTFRVIYVVKSERGIFILHVFAKKSQATLKRDVAPAKQRLKEIS
jgi:phage-related protein